MSVHLIKLCVGIESISHLRDRQAARIARMAAKGEIAELRHRTRQMPRRRSELLEGGSIYWVIKGSVSVRQGLLDLRQVRGDDGIRRCDLILDPQLVPTRPRRRRAFQGWRYLSAGDAPKDLGLSDAEANLMPEEMRSELIKLGLL